MNDKNTLSVLLIQPMKPPSIIEINEKLEFMQILVGSSLVEIMPFDEEIAIVCIKEWIKLIKSCTNIDTIDRPLMIKLIDKIIVYVSVNLNSISKAAITAVEILQKNDAEVSQLTKFLQSLHI